MHPKNISKTVSETCAKWSQFGAVSETQGLALGVEVRLNLYLMSISEQVLQNYFASIVGRGYYEGKILMHSKCSQLKFPARK